jgi:hypothetical protein
MSENLSLVWRSLKHKKELGTNLTPCLRKN